MTDPRGAEPPARALPREAAADPKRAADDAQLCALSATAAVALMSRGELQAERYAEALLARCSARQALGAFITLEPPRVLETARARDLERRAGAAPGPLFGLPIPIKDSVNTRDYRTTGGTPALRDFRPRDDAPVVALLRAAGALVLGKTNLHELSYGWTSDNEAFGAVHNPYDPARIAGGSSGGTAAAVAAGCAPLGVAADTEGSIRVPAAFCGIAGFRPTTGRYPTQACIPITPLFDQVGPQARSVVDLLLFDAVVAGDSRPIGATDLRGLRIGIVHDPWFEGLDPQVERLTDLALGKLKQAGVQLVESELPGVAALVERSTAQVQNHDVRIALANYLDEFGADLDFEQVVALSSPGIQAMFRRLVMPGGAQFVSEADYRSACELHLPALRALYRDYFARTGVAAIVFPTTLIAAPRIGEDRVVAIGGRTVRFETAVARNIAPGSSAGLPGLVLPIGLTAEGLPVSLEFDGPAAADRGLLALGASLEPLFGRLPPPIS